MSPMQSVGRCTAILVTLVLISAGMCLAQSDLAQISGLVKDPSGAIIPGASVSITNEVTRIERTVLANDQGYYVASNLPPGFYTIAVEITGFKRYVKTGNKLDPNINTKVDVTLEVGQLSETVSVTASAANVQSDTATVGKLVESTQIEKMMLNGRNPLFLALLKPGVRGGSLAGFSFTMSSGGFSINGSRSQDYNIAFDGAVAMRTRANGTSIGAVDVESVQEMQILTANYNAEYGRSAGGQIRMVTKSGGRDFHGSVYEYFRNNALDANSWSRNRAGQPVSAQRYNQFGYVASGPIYIPGAFNTDRSKLFFLWSQEWIRRRSESTSIVVVPSMAMRSGDFSELLDPANPFFSRVRIVKDPDTGQPFDNNVIPASRLSPNGLGFLKTYPEPTPGFLQGRNNFLQTRPNPQNQRKDTLSIDYVPSAKHTFRFRGQLYSYTALDAFRGGFDLACTDWDRPNRTASLNYIWTISPTFINEFLATASEDIVLIEVQREGERYSRSKRGINYPYLFPERKEIPDKIPTIDISNFQNIDGGPYPSSSYGPIYVFSDNLTKIWGTHTLKFGFSFERSGQDDFDQINVSGVPGGTNNQNGRFIFDDTRAGAATTGLAIANAAMGLFTSYAEVGPRARTPYRSHMLEWFAQDSWRVSEKLRLEYGLRHTYMTPYYFSLWGNIAVFDPTRYDPAKAVVQDPSTGYIISGDRFNGVIIPGSNWPDAAKGRVLIADTGEYDRLFSGGPNYYAERHFSNFQPRLGLAYSITPKSVIRAGFGRFMARPGVSDNIFLGGNPPFQPMVSIANGLADNPAGGKPSYFPQFFMTMDPVFKIPSSYMWNFTYEQEVGLETTVSVGYVGRVGLNLERERNLNTLEVGTLQRPENKGINVNVLRPYKGFAQINIGENASRSEYNGLQLEATRRFAKGLSYGVAYTYSKSFDNASGRREFPYNPLDDKSYWGPSGFDTRHVMVINYIWEIPFLKQGNTVAAKMLGGWTVSGVTQFQTGTPFSIGTGEDFAGIGSGNATQLWNLAGDISLPRGDRKFSEGAADSNFYFKTKTSDAAPIATAPAAGTFASQTKNIAGNHPGFQNWNIALFKDFRFTESQRLSFRAEFFNFPNHPNWGNVDTNPRSGTFGKVTSKSSERNVQLSLRYSF